MPSSLLFFFFLSPPSLSLFSLYPAPLLLNAALFLLWGRFPPSGLFLYCFFYLSICSPLSKQCVSRVLLIPSFRLFSSTFFLFFLLPILPKKKKEKRGENKNDAETHL